MAAPRLCVVGSSNIDLISEVPRLPKLGETLVVTPSISGMAARGPLRPS